MDNQEQQDNQIESVPGPALRKPRISIPALLIGVLLLVVAISIGLGYWLGVRELAVLDQQKLDAYLVDQYNLALGDLQAGRYDFAQQRLDDILARNPDYPGAKEAQEKVTRLQNTTPTALPTATIMPSPTPNVALGEQMYQKARQQYKDKDFKGMMLTLLIIQRDVPSFNPLRIEGLLFLSLQEQGLADIKALNLESGLYHLWLASKYAPLDAAATDKMDWARLVLNSYQAAYHYRKVDLEKSVINFSTVYVLAPGYRTSLVQDYTDTLNAFIKQISNDDCYIQNKLNEIIAHSPNDNLLTQKRDEAAGKCLASQPPKPTSSPTEAAPTPG
jgi:hypothetical protein